MRYGITLLAFVTLPIACADPCVDDGVNQENEGNCPGQAEASQTASAEASGTGTEASATQTESDTDSAGTQGSVSMTGDTETADGTVSDSDSDTDVDTDEGGPGCMNGVLDGDESDVDCGGSCPGCGDGQVCHSSEDCESDACTTEEICDGSNSCTTLIDDNGCQACIKTNCCEAVEECFMDEFCHCWVECIEHNNDFDPCVQECMGTMKPGSITSCANSDCGYEGACG